MSDTEAAGRPFGIRDDRARGVLLAEEDGRTVGQIVYFTLADPATAPEPATAPDPATALVPVHTEVPPAHEGRGIAGALAAELYALAAREGRAVVPLCPYVAKWAERHRAPAPAAALVEAALAKVEEDPSTW
ncbi:GNAT family N-acetyltransferase [Streptomyces sp. AN091965]|uniref:GNAT family N-acetyltransferase n=1 Tax=Streptomyces sp. AN091965 TaxID=2927803 RepID=UPI001F625213|nr:N-acetyltransferase [Streptomyces sp. AN091965]MCI3934381.1 N-acetyltransferase [Streptomyces sp. AN091965]